MNVISNGADYCPDEGTLVIRAEEERQQESCFLKITVTDSGPGFTEEALLHGTEQFYQADKSRKRDRTLWNGALYYIYAASETRGTAGAWKLQKMLEEW